MCTQKWQLGFWNLALNRRSWACAAHKVTYIYEPPERPVSVVSLFLFLQQSNLKTAVVLESSESVRNWKMENKYKIQIVLIATAISIFFFTTKFRRHGKKSRKSSSSCYLKTEPKPQHYFKRVLADNSYSPFKHLILNLSNDGTYFSTSEIASPYFLNLVSDFYLKP